MLIDFEEKFCFQRHIGLIRVSKEIHASYLYYLLCTPYIKKQADDVATGVAQKTVSLKALRSFKVPLPPLETQLKIVAEMDHEHALVRANHELVSRFEKKIQATIGRVWEESLVETDL